MPPEAGALNCPTCGASVASDSPNCLHCGTRLAAIACSSCFAMIFDGSRFCPHCGARVQRQVTGGSGLPCPRCKAIELVQVQLGDTALGECSGCHGVWVDVATFDSICSDQERQALV